MRPELPISRVPDCRTRLCRPDRKQGRVLGTQSHLRWSFAAVGFTFEESEYFVLEFKRDRRYRQNGAVTNMANDPAVKYRNSENGAYRSRIISLLRKNMMCVIITDNTTT
jgi:V/A-type H+-transporting ATPase subunit B